MSSTVGPSAASQYNATPIFNALVPREGPKMIPYVCDFPGAPEYLIDLSLTESQSKMKVVQTIFLDNSQATAAVTVSIAGTQFEIVAGAETQGFYPVLAPNNTKFTVSSASTGPVTIIFVNVPCAANQWATVDGGAGGTVDAVITGPLASAAPAAGSTPVNVSQQGGVTGWVSHSTATVAAASTALIPAAGPGGRAFVRIKAPEAADLWINAVGGAAGLDAFDCFKIPAGSLYENFPGESVWQAWHYWCATGGLALTAHSQDGN
jgi:hypothetical protein